MGKPPKRDYSNRTKNYSNRTFCIRPDYSNRTFYACNLLIIIENPWIVFTLFKEWAFLGFKASSFTHRASPPRLSEKSRRELKSLYPYTGATTNFQSSLGVLLLYKTVSPENGFHRRALLSIREFWQRAKFRWNPWHYQATERAYLSELLTFFCKRKKRFGGIFGDRCLWGRRSAPVAHDWWEKTYRPKRQSKITNLFFKD